MCIDDIVCQRLRLKIFRVGLKQPLASYSKDTCLVLFCSESYGASLRETIYLKGVYIWVFPKIGVPPNRPF